MDSIINDYETQAKEIEIECANILNSSNKKKDLIISEAKTKAAITYTEQIKFLEAEKANKISKINQIIEKKKNDLIKNADKDLESIQKLGNSNVDKAVKYVLSQLDIKYKEL